MRDAEVVVVGNGVSGFAAADRLARNGVRPLLVGAGPVVDRPPLSKAAIAEGQPQHLADEERLAALNIDRHDGVLEGADLEARTLVLGGPDGPVVVRAEHIVLSTGLTYEPPPVEGLGAAHVNAAPEGLPALVRQLAEGPRTVL